MSLRPLRPVPFLLLALLGGWGLAHLQGLAHAGPPSPAGYILGPEEGEALSRGPTSIRVKADPLRGSRSMAVGTQQLPQGAGIPLHQHPGMDEVLFVLDGAGTGLLGDGGAPIEKGSTLFIPRGTWHGVQNPDGGLTVLWAVSPPGLEAYFREATPRPGAPALTREQVQELARKHGTIFR